VPQASAALEGRSGSTQRGTADFFVDGEDVTVRLAVSGARPGRHGVHLHERADCSAMDASSAGGHWNPGLASHGAFEASPSHLGDLGNLEVAADGTGTMLLTTRRWSLSSGRGDDIVGHSLVIHADADDVTTQPAGNSGDRVACGVVLPSIMRAERP